MGGELPSRMQTLSCIRAVHSQNMCLKLMYCTIGAEPVPRFQALNSQLASRTAADTDSLSETTEACNSLQRFPCALIEIKFPHLKIVLGGLLSHRSDHSVG